MPLFHKLRQYLPPSRRKESDPAAAYDIWALSYDHQPDNLMLALDEELCAGLFSRAPITSAVVVDIGCGTGRHWAKLFDQGPARLVGYDVSPGMLTILQKKHPQAETYLLKGKRLAELERDSCDLVLSTLTIAHIPDLEGALAEWTRILRPGGEMIITDYHPSALAKGGQRTFREGERVIAIRNYIYPIGRIREIALKLGLKELSITERKIDETMRPYYEKQNALAVFGRFRGVPIIYGIHLKKSDAAQ
jgi:ubiquinone/menaquinone biosynthesis C-methylase UbiE